MPLKEKLQQEKPWAILGWTRKQWKAQKMWKKAEVNEEKITQLWKQIRLAICAYPPVILFLSYIVDYRIITGVMD